MVAPSWAASPAAAIATVMVGGAVPVPVTDANSDLARRAGANCC